MLTQIRLSVFIKHWGLKAVCKLPKNMFQLEVSHAPCATGRVLEQPKELNNTRWHRSTRVHRSRTHVPKRLTAMLTYAMLLPLQTAALCSFVRQHRVQRTDTLQMLAVRHGTDVNTLKRTNNMISDHSMYSRHHLYIPGAAHATARSSAVVCDCSMLHAAKAPAYLLHGCHAVWHMLPHQLAYGAHACMHVCHMHRNVVQHARPGACSTCNHFIQPSSHS